MNLDRHWRRAPSKSLPILFEGEPRPIRSLQLTPRPRQSFLSSVPRAYVENTLTAFCQAMAHGAEVIEVDLRGTRGGQITATRTQPGWASARVQLAALA